jgi:carbamoyl-phosphate synthase small subunit
MVSAIPGKNKSSVCFFAKGRASLKGDMKAILALEDGTVFEGISFGAQGTVVGEICFNTSMTGYQEILTDPSYKGQIVTLTYPEIGNYGTTPEDVESYKPHASGLVVRELSPVASSFRSRKPLSDYLLENGIPGIKHVDTRALTKKLRVQGAMKSVLTTELSAADAVDRARAWHGLVGVDYVKEVTCAKPFVWDEQGLDSPVWYDDNEKKLHPGIDRLPPVEYHIVAYDFGIKFNILRRLREQGFGITVVPATTSAEEVLKLNPDGVFLSNGPGDPAAVTYAHEAVKGLMGRKPLFGICLGHQILGHAVGAGTFKLKFGHRGGNQPVKDLTTGQVKITSQNHGFAVNSDKLDPKEIELTHINLNDGTCEGMRHKGASAFSVQYHPEAAPGPHDAAYFFDLFRKEVERSKQTK